MKVDEELATSEILLLNERFLLLPEKAIFWPRERMLIVADVHLGKAGHFRKHGLAVPGNIHFQDLETLRALIESTQAGKVLFLGDLFHSEVNHEWTIFGEWIQSFPHLTFLLAVGNHDILPKDEYVGLGFELHEVLRLHQFSFSHEEIKDEGYYNFSGHVHPGVKFRGRGKQGFRVPCFYFRRHNGYLPAFGTFTGVHPIKKAKGDRVFVIAGGQVTGVV